MFSFRSICVLVLMCLTVKAQAQKYQYNSQHGNQNQQQQNNQHYPAGHQESFLDHADREHIAHDLKDQYYADIDKDKVPEQEMDFYNFKLHDLDSNFLLDGLELLSAMTHEHNEHKEVEDHHRGSADTQNDGQKTVDNNAVIIDHVLTEYDQDKDGYISFAEFKRVRASIHN